MPQHFENKLRREARMRKRELEELLADQDKFMEKAYDAIIGGNPEAARVILANALRLTDCQPSDPEIQPKENSPVSHGHP